MSTHTGERLKLVARHYAYVVHDARRISLRNNRATCPEHHASTGGRWYGPFHVLKASAQVDAASHHAAHLV